MSGFFIVAMCLYGFIISRWHGGGFISGSPKVLKNILWALPFGLCSFYALLPNTNYFVSSTVATISFLMCLGGKATGHGRVWNPFKELDQSKNPEFLEGLIIFLQGMLSDFGYKTVAMSLIGFAAVSGAAFSIGYIDTMAGIIVGAGGALKSVSYIVGRILDEEDLLDDLPKEIDEPTEIGEGLTGIFAFAGLAIGFLMVI